jgi:hypothetical protein
MIRRELSETLVALVESFLAAPDSGLVVTGVTLDVPLEVLSGVRDGRLVFYGSPPHTRWRSGVLPPVHLSRLEVELVEGEEEAGGG